MLKSIYIYIMYNGYIVVFVDASITTLNFTVKCSV